MLTSAGRATVVVMFVLGFLGYLLGYVELLAMSVACLVALASGILVVLLPLRVELDRKIAPLRVTRGDRAVGVLMVRNLSRRSQRIYASEQCGTAKIPIVVPRLVGKSMRQVGYLLPTERRAILSVGPVRQERSDLLGFARRSEALGTVEQLVVHPRIHTVALAASGRVRQLDGPTSDAAPRGTITFHALREYVPGDDRRAIHWRSSARLGSLMVREYVDTALPQTTVLLDTRVDRYDDQDRFDEAVDFAASLVIAAAKARSPVRFVATSGLNLDLSGTGGDLRSILDQFAGLLPSKDAGFAQIPAAVSIGQFSGVLVGIAGSIGEDDLAALRALAYRHETATLIQCLPTERADAAAASGLVVLQGANAAELAAKWNDWIGQ